MEQFSNSIFKNIYQPDNFKELLDLICKAANPDDGLVRMWRGQSNVNWEIHSSAYRRLSMNNKKVTEDGLISYEKRLLKHAKHKGYHISNGRIISDFELLALLQHNGAATRLVDFSRSAFVALWFAIFTLPKETGLLYGAHAYYIGGYEGEPEERPYDEAVAKLQKYNHPVTWEPTTVTPRVAAQHSQFLYSDISTSKMGSIKIAQENDANLFIAISPKLKIEAKNILIEVFDIREQTLFPDLNGFSIANNSFKHEEEMLRW